MDVNKILQEKQFQLFKTQNPDEGFFDVIFDIGGKKLYADKFRLAAISTTFRSMLSNRWNSKNEPIKSERHSYNDFKEFLTFIYSGECNLTSENIFAMVDIAEFYNVEILKNVCEEYLEEIEISSENIFQMMEMADKYSMKQLKKTAFNYFIQNFDILRHKDQFLSLDGAVIKEFLCSAGNKIQHEDVFATLSFVYKWAEHQAELKKAESNDENFNLNGAIKNELSELLPHIQFRKMKLEFLHKYVVSKAFLFPSYKDLSDILRNCNPELTVIATSPNGQMLKGKIPHDDSSVKFIKSLKNFPSVNSTALYWDRKCKIPSTPCRLKKSEEVDWYLIYFSNPFLGIVHRSILNGHYVVAEMYGETNIAPSGGWKIKIV